MIRFSVLFLLTLAAASPLTMAQLASSTNYQLLAEEFAGGGGGTCSVGFAMMFASEPVSGDPVAPVSSSAHMGFLAASDPEPTNAPVVFGITPDCGPVTGGVGITITGLTPAGTAGAKDVVVSSVYGSGTLPGGYEYSAGLIPYGTGTPGCLGSQTMSAASCPHLDNPAFILTVTNVPALALGLGLVTDSPDFTGTDVFGLGILLHVDLFFATPTEIYSLDMTSNVSNFGTVTTAIPNNPVLIGKNYYAQSIWVETACILGTVASLSSSRGLHIVIEP